ncbi:charged multivesicular body protein 4b-like [Haliotis rubra]|uniref:charged multivesicular body protein 4b-like n=1 Tax=Haliotis rubra TaxID=36100 RepID=UPI001EE600E8|nr:charged multivesicular body protein 4b-like [Haliotis rubra]XP_046568530.1 charged multivesicular body protein 4b-like [Haliotis rubra]XP_046568531.1 charged multivesicular body protein 4b-like [Haliotis rubra]
MAQSLMFWKRKDEISTEEAIERLRNLQELLSKKTDYLENKIDAETKTALENRGKNKRAALQALRRRKRYEKQLQQVDGTTASLEVQLEALTSASVNVEVARCLRLTSEAIQRTFGNMTADKVADLRDEVSDRMEDVEEIGNILAQPLGGEEFDDDDLLAELEEMDQDDLINKLSDIQLPSVPTEELKTKGDKKTGKAKEEEEEDREMRKLAEWV